MGRAEGENEVGRTLKNSSYPFCLMKPISLLAQTNPLKVEFADRSGETLRDGISLHDTRLGER